METESDRLGALPAQHAPPGPVRSGAVPVLVPDVYGVVPNDLLITDRVSVWAQLQQGVSSVPSFLEGPVMDGSGNLFVVDIAWGRILRFAPDGEVNVVVEYDGEPNGLAFDARGQLHIADYRNGVMVTNLRDGTVEPLLQRRGYDRLRGVNDLTFDESGNLYFTDQGGSDLQNPNGVVYRRKPDGTIDPVARNIPSPNGVVYDESTGHLYVAVTRDNAIWRVQRAPDGSTRAGRWIQLSGGIGPDGLAMDAAGRLYVAHPGLGVVWVFDRKGLPLLAIQSNVGDFTTNMHVDQQSGHVYITESRSGSVLVADAANALSSL